MKRLRRLARYSLRQWPHLLVIAPLTLASAAAVALRPWPIKLLVDFGLGDATVSPALHDALGQLGLSASPLTLIVLAGFASLVVFLLASLLGAALTISWARWGQGMVRDLAVDVFDRLQRLSLGFHAGRPVGDSLARVTDDTWCVYTVTNGLLIAPLQQILTFTAMSVAAFALDPELATWAVLMAPLLALSALWFGNRLKRRARLDREARSRLMSFVHQTLEALPIVQAFGSEGRNRQRFDRMADESVAISQRGTLLNSAFGMVNSLVTTAGSAVILIVGGLRVLDGQVTLGTLLVFIAYVQAMQGASKSLFATFAKLKAAEASVDRVFDLIDCQETVREVPAAPPLPIPSGTSQGLAVRIDDVTFGYEPARPVLRDVRLQVSPGETVALVGPTGAGKSTLLSLLPRFFDPWQGSVLVGGVDVTTVSLESLRGAISMVLQDDYLLPLSVWENITYARPDASRAQVERAARIARAHDFIERLPQSYETPLAEWGRTLSGGERQRLAIARAILRDAPLLIFDEPTSALDSETETAVTEGLAWLTGRRTTLLIAHRLSTVRGADRIVFLDQGRVLETGTHDELMRQRGHYHRLYTAQRFATGREDVA